MKYQIPSDILWVFELIFVLLGFGAIVTAALRANLAILVMLVPFTLSYGFVLFFSMPRHSTARS